MEEKYCERCGAFLGFVNPCKKYCEECKIIVRKERQALIKKGIKIDPEPALCAWCKKKQWFGKSGLKNITLNAQQMQTRL